MLGNSCESKIQPDLVCCRGAVVCGDGSLGEYRQVIAVKWS